MKQRDGLAQPAWLDGQTIAIVSTVLAVGVGIGAMVFSSTSSLRGEIKAVRSELSDEIKTVRSELSEEIKAVRSGLSEEIRGLDARLRTVEQDVAVVDARLRTVEQDVAVVDARLRTVEQDVAVIKARLPVRHPVTHGASPLDREEDDAEA